MLSIVGAEDERRYRPYGGRHRTLTADVECRPCRSRYHARRCPDRRCLTEVTEAMVLEELSRMWQADTSASPTGGVGLRRSGHEYSKSSPAFGGRGKPSRNPVSGWAWLSVRWLWMLTAGGSWSRTGRKDVEAVSSSPFLRLTHRLMIEPSILLVVTFQPYRGVPNAPLFFRRDSRLSGALGRRSRQRSVAGCLGRAHLFRNLRVSGY